jgi:hypothetical protein
MQMKKVASVMQIAIGVGLVGFGIFLWTLHPIMIGMLLVGGAMIVRGLNEIFDWV